MVMNPRNSTSTRISADNTAVKDKQVGTWESIMQWWNTKTPQQQQQQQGKEEEELL